MPLIRLGTSPLGGGQLPQHPLTVARLPLQFGTTRLGKSLNKFRGTIQLGRYMLGGGGFVPPDPRNAYMLWSAGTNVTFLPQVNGVTEQFTSKLNNEPQPKTKLGLSFTLGYGGIVSYLGQSDSPTFDGATDVAIDATKFTNLVGNGWFQFIIAPSLTGTTPLGPVTRIDIRVPAYEYLSGVNRLAPPGLYYSPFNVRHLTGGISPYALNLNRLTMSGIMASWTWHVPVVAQYARINVINLVSSQTALSAFSNTLTGTTPSGTVTFRQSGMSQSLFSYKIIPAIYLISGSINIAAMTMDGATNVAYNAQFVSVSGVQMDGTFNWTLNAIKSFAGDFQCDGATDVAYTAQRLVYGDWACDGATDVSITTYGVFDTSMLMEGVTDVSIEPFRIGYGPWNGDGTTDVSVDVYQIFAGNLTMDGSTAVAIDSRQIYTSTNNFTMDGNTAFALTARQSFAANLTMDGTCNVVVAQTVSILSGNITMDGSASQTLDTVADFFVQITADGTTDVTINAAFNPIVQIVATGVGDMFFLGALYAFPGFNADGRTDVGYTARLNAVAEINIVTGIKTDVEITPLRIVNVFLNMDGSASVFLQVSQDQFGEVIIDQINQEMSALGSFIFTDGSVYPTANSTATFNGRHIPLGPDYIWGIIEKDTGYGSPNFVPLSVGSFTASGKSALNTSGPNELGYHKHKYAFGFSRPTAAFYDKRTRDFTREEWVRFNFFVDSAVDFSQISSSTGFTSSGISGVGGSGVVGRDIEKYVTFSVLTHGIMTQANYEAIADGDPNAAMTQANYEMLWIPDSNVFNTQTVGEVLYLANLAAIQQLATEAMATSVDGQRRAAVQQLSVEMLHTIRAAGLITQTSIEGIQGEGDPNVNMTLATIEILTYAQQFFNATAVIQQAAVEQIATGDPRAVINAVAIEEVNNGDPKARLNSEAIETVHNNDRNAAIQSIAIEELNGGQGNGAVQQIAIEYLVRPEYDPTVAALVNNPRYHI